MLIPVMTVAENIVLGVGADAARPQLDLETAARARARALGELRARRRPRRASIEDIGVGQQQRVEILKALYRDARVLILDEPTAVLTPQEVDDLFGVLARRSRDGGDVDHPDHAQAATRCSTVADRISVLRRGKKVGHDRPRGRERASLAELMVGRERAAATSSAAGAPRRGGARGARPQGARRPRARRPCAASRSSVSAGEIVGIAGVDGNGQSELVQALAGMRTPARRRRSSSSGATSTHASPRATPRRLGVGHIPEDRQRHGLVLDFSLAENCVLHDYDDEPISRHGWLDRDAMARARERSWIELYDVRGGGPSAPARALSGGNQQKVVLAREIQSDPRVADRRAADARPRRRRDRVRAPPPRRAARRRLRRPARLARARRGARPRRPHPRDVRRPDRARAASGRRTSASSASP